MCSLTQVEQALLSVKFVNVFVLTKKRSGLYFHLITALEKISFNAGFRKSYFC